MHTVFNILFYHPSSKIVRNLFFNLLIYYKSKSSKEKYSHTKNVKITKEK